MLGRDGVEDGEIELGEARGAEGGGGGASAREGLSWADARDRAALDGPNAPTPPINCPPAICCLLPCLSALPSMRAFAAAVPEDALALREGEWCDVEAKDLVVGDVVLFQERETAPADLVVLAASDDFEIGTAKLNGSKMTHRPGPDASVALGSVCLHGNCRGTVAAVADDTVLAKRIRDGQWPPRT